MKISPIINHRYVQIMKKPDVKTEKPLQGITNPKIYDMPSVSFRAIVHIDDNSLYEKCYEDIVLDSQGKIKNDSKYLVISSAEHIGAISRTPSAQNKYYMLSNDIDMDGYDFEPIGTSYNPFTGIFDGNGYTIKNLKIQNHQNDSGMFRVTKNAKIKNLKLEGLRVEGTNGIGGIVGNSSKTTFTDCDINGTVKGSMCVGGLVGISELNTFENIKFSGEIETPMNPDKEAFSCDRSYIGGIIGLDSGSHLKGICSDASIKSDAVIGGLVGETGTSYILPTIIEDAAFDGELISSKEKGGIIGDNKNSIINRAVSLKFDLVGTGENPETKDCITNLYNIRIIPHSFENSGYWQVSQNRVPRLKRILDMYNPLQIFMSDINNSRENGEIINLSEEYNGPENVELLLKIEKPKHYEENEEQLTKIKNSDDPNWLHNLFKIYTNAIVYSENPEKNDELILELVKNSNLPVNERYGDDGGYAVGCTPLYVASRIAKPYIFREMLNRQDINLDQKCGIYDDATVFDNMQKFPTSEEDAYVLFSTKNEKVRKHIDKKMSDFNRDYDTHCKLLNFINRNYPDIPAYNEETQKISLPVEYFDEIKLSDTASYDSGNKYMHSLEDVMRNMDVNSNYTDINGNNIINIAVGLDDELYAFTVFSEAAEVLDCNLKNKNIYGLSPLKQLLESGKNQSILPELIKNIPESMYETNYFGENAIHIISRNSNEQKAIKYIKSLNDIGMSVNMQDNGGNTALMNALEEKHKNLFNFLIRLKANVNYTNFEGQNILHKACQNCESIQDFEYIRILLDRRVNPFVRDKNGHLPYDYLSDEMKILVNMPQEELDNFCRNAGLEQGCKAIEYNLRTEFLKDSEISTESSEIYKQPSFTQELSGLAIGDIFAHLDTNDKQKQQNALIHLLRYLSGDNPVLETDNGISLTHLVASINDPLAEECLLKIFTKYPQMAKKIDTCGQNALMTSIENYSIASNDFERQCCLDNIDTIVENKPDVNALDNNSQNIMHNICQLECLYLLSKFLDLNVNINQKDVFGRNPIEYLSREISDKMRNYYENFARNKGLTIANTNLLKGLKK